MSLQFIIGNSGAGKSFWAYQKIIQDAMKHPERMYYVIVPEQFTMQTQKTLVEMHPGKGILNIDVLSFERLSYRIFEEVGGAQEKLLEETGKSMVLQRIIQEKEKELFYLRGQMKKPGYIDQMKSLISELMQYDISSEDLDRMQENLKDRKLLEMKLKDIGVLYESFREYLRGNYITSEEVLDILWKILPLSEKMKGSTVLLDGYTGFTPIQNKIVQEFLQLADCVYVTVTMDVREEPFKEGKPHQLFYMSRKMIQSLLKVTKDVQDPIYIEPGKEGRFGSAPALFFLEQNLFRYRRECYKEPQSEISIYKALNPKQELKEAVRRIHRLAREKGYRYGEMAVITPDLETYGSLAGAVFSEAGIPCFVDEKHSVLMNPFVEFLRAVMEMISSGFTYETVFRYLRSGMTDLKREEADLLENYALALGIRGYEKWNEKWVRIYPGMSPEELPFYNELRESFVKEIDELREKFLHGKHTVLSYVTALYEFILRCRVPEKLYLRERGFAEEGKKAMEKEYAQIYGIVMELLDKMVEILGDQMLNISEFRQLLETGLSEAKVALIPPGMDEVLIGDIERTRLKDVKALFLVGINDGNIPKNMEKGGFLTETDREYFTSKGIELAPGVKEQAAMQKFYLYQNLTKPSEHLCLSYSLSDAKGEAKNPAYLIASIRNLFVDLSIELAGDVNDPFRFLEAPGTSLDYFLEGLLKEHMGEKDILFSELYSWYLKDPAYRPVIENLVSASFMHKPADSISRAVAKVLYGEVSAYSATRLEKFAACAFAHFLRYGLSLSERAEYEFRAMDMGNIMHKVLEDFAVEVHKQGLSWRNLDDRKREEILDYCLERAASDYGNTILKTNARNRFLVERTRRILRRTVWALQEQLRNGEFEPEGFEISFGNGRIDRLDVLEKDDKIYVKIIDYKTGNTTFDLVSVYHGLQLQLMIYLDAAMETEQRKYPDKEIEPAGIFYYNVDDPMIQSEMEEDILTVQEKILKELKMNGLVLANQEVARSIDATLSSIPVGINKDGNFRKTASVASREQFELLHRYVKQKIDGIQEEILGGNTDISPYELRKKEACTYCPYHGVCGYDRKIPGFEHRRLKQFSDEELWARIEKEEM